MIKRGAPSSELPLRRRVVVSIFALSAATMVWRAVDLQRNDREFLQNHGDARYLRVVATDASRGMVLDRSGEPLAISTPIQSVWVRPDQFVEVRDRWPALAAVLETTVDHFEALVLPRLERKFVYLRRHVSPQQGAEITRMGVPGVAMTEEYRRYYPAAEVTAHVLGFTNVDDKGQEGIELVFDDILAGQPGRRLVIKDRLGRVIEDVERLRPTRPGNDVRLSIDKRLQYIAYRELKSAVLAHRAKAGSMVIVDVRSGEILALVNRPSLNPNNRNHLKGEHYRNRAVTDLFEPGSTLKPFTIAAALESGKYTINSHVDTAPGFFKVGRHVVRDPRNFGELNVGEIVEKSSNVGASKVALSLESETLWRLFRACGFGSLSGAPLPGEAHGRLSDFPNWREIEHATLAFGYGMSVTALQLARAYMVFANDGYLIPLAIVRAEQPVPRTRVIERRTAAAVREMLTRVITHGTGGAAAVPGYSVAGKTGTVHKSTVDGYAEDRYLSLFAGMIPASSPRLVAIVVIDEPKRGEHFGGRVAAPIFSKVMGEATRIFNIPADMSDADVPDPVWLASGIHRQGTQGLQ